MHIEFLVDEESKEAALKNLVPGIIGTNDFGIVIYQNLMGDLLRTLRAYRRWMPLDWKIVVLIDRDQKDCRELKARLEEAAHTSGLSTKSSARGQANFQVLNRLSIEELEAWFFGDPEAIHKAYPRIPANISNKAAYRDADAIRGGTWEALQKELQRKNYYPGGLPKIEVARNISGFMVPERNRSRSFQVFRNGLLAIAAI